jgi:Calpain family cysteine protease
MTIEKSLTSAGVVNPFALVEAKLRRTVDWSRIADRKKFVESVLNFPYDKLFDPKYESPLYPHGRYDAKAKAMIPRQAENWYATLTKPDAHSAAAGGYGGSSVNWEDPGTFFTNAPDFTAPVQGGLPDCHFISAMAALAWSNPFAMVHQVRPIHAKDTIKSAGTMARIPFFGGTGAAPAGIEVTERLPLIEPGDVYQYARSGHKKETWPAVYEKAWVKWFTGDPGDHPDYTKVTGGDPVADLVNLTGLSPSYASTQPMTGDQIWNDVRSHCRGSWTFDPMVACTYASDSAAPTPVNYNSAGLVAWHCYAILGWQQSGAGKYIVLRNPWGYHEATLNVDNGPWTSFDQFEGGVVVGTLTLPEHGVFALRADTFQQYFASYGWVS